ncbi:APC family permease [Variovorax sp. YR752]|uniref:APC family permease n=1 Tax=Variovorax sp. YR752 TaxID=1884383 RepID=UPI003137C666
MTTSSKPAVAGLGFSALFAAAIGAIVAQIGMVSSAQGIGIGGWGFVGALFIAFAISMANAFAYAEMSLMLPSQGSLSSFAEAAIGNFPAIMLVFAGYVTPAIFGLPAELILADTILTQALGLPLPAHFWPVAIVVLFAALNILGTDVFARVQTVLSFVVLLFLGVVGIVALSGSASAAPDPAAGLAQLSHEITVFGLVALAFWVFAGIEFVTPLVTEARDARRDLPRAMFLGLTALLVVQLLFVLGAASLLPREKLATAATPHLDVASAVFGPGGRVFVAVLALLASASLINTVLAAVPRMLAGMADNGQVFPLLKYRHPKFGTPVVAILFVAALPLVGLFWSGGSVEAILPLMIAASVAWLMAYIMAQVSLMVLRRRHPELPRPFKVPGYPLVPLLAIAGMVFVIANSSPAPEMTRAIATYTGVVLLVFAVVGAVWVKAVMKKGLFEPVKPHLG